MKVLFLVMVVAHLAQSLVVHWRHPKPEDRSKAERAVAATVQSVMFVAAFYIAWRSGVFDRSLLSPVHVGAGLLAGHLIFGLSLLIIYRSVDDATSYFLDFGALWRFVVEHPYVMSRFIVVGVTEEIVWRAVAQPTVMSLVGGWGPMLGPTLAISTVAIAFALVHDHFFRNSFVVSLEFLVFAFLLGGLYYWTHSLILVIIVHAMRDIEICHLEYIVKVQEYGDEERAARDIEQTYMGRLQSGRELGGHD